MFKIADALTNGNNVNVEYNNLFYNNTKIRWTQAPTDCSNTITLVLLYDWIKYKKKPKQILTVCSDLEMEQIGFMIKWYDNNNK